MKEKFQMISAVKWKMTLPKTYMAHQITRIYEVILFGRRLFEDVIKLRILQ